jgi:hypothetical protein
MQYSGFNGIFQIWREITACDVYIASISTASTLLHLLDENGGSLPSATYRPARKVIATIR